MRSIGALASLALSVAFTAASYAQAQQMQNVVEEVFKRAVLKVDVSTPVPVFDASGNNICKSEGTAFLIGKQLAVTASHVYALDKACGPPVIALESKGFNVEVFAEVLAVYDDVTVLKFDGLLPEPMCALALSGSDVTSVDGVRFGIPGGMYYPSPMPVRIGSINSDFNPFVQLTPTPAESGESGGPVIYMFSVVGILRAKHVQYPAFSVMTPVGQLHSLITQKALALEPRLCNPVEFSIFQTDSVNFGARIQAPAASTTQAVVPSSPDLQNMISAARSNGIEVTSFVANGSATIELRSHSRAPAPLGEAGGGAPDGGGSWGGGGAFGGGGSGDGPAWQLPVPDTRDDLQHGGNNDIIGRDPDWLEEIGRPNEITRRVQTIADENREQINSYSNRIADLAKAFAWQQYISALTKVNP
ncbi:trypsin-like peptidase domain-containing protein [Rhizobium leguminosarum]|uniref:trypsin-like peptidase domain-containing protein n=1 Tax=Rhizobium leguminosarum TaxID=384 RepID=UPI001A930864|nr:trypsin-like peptidase domain-containing protein [Rhizobium leguminosarum]MBY5554150.1 trypsin-like peptidase domain-containing protein [Rhizobium leguminosarum]MBY5728590.1 trypsin-like peptidase domain-containing protein [Rhizobium leguminosarum]QSW27270.1 trypsin-like peptidase domain-containing protein [Rhizobium leguminosarum]